ncbi:hypothetical protein ACFYU9_35390 [Streptomyces sp. NPDC004327]|uniref:hypothetical protein n=1 Tax=Streptomyces sp. NPDC004327 TaxID=3364699 RepID=UPI0036930FF5
MSAKWCAYCDKPIIGEAIDVTEYSDRGAHPAVWWHEFGAPECVRDRPAAPSLLEPHIGGKRVNGAAYRHATGRRTL